MPAQWKAWKWNIFQLHENLWEMQCWLWDVPHHPSDGLSCSQGSFLPMHQVAQHPHLPGQGGAKQHHNQEAGSFCLPAQLCWGDGSGKHHLHESTVVLKSCFLWNFMSVPWGGREKENEQAVWKCLHLNRIFTEGCSRPWFSWELITSGTSV